MVPDLVSTIIPVHNRPEMIREAVASVLAQSWTRIEIILVDDGSTDRTPSVLAELAATNPGCVQVARQDNAGPGAARETGRRLACGEFIQYLDSDDLLLPDKFADQVSALRANPDCGIAYGMTHHSAVGGSLEPVAFKRTAESFESLFPAVLRSRWWSTSTPLYRRSTTDAVGAWLPLINEEDWEYDARTARLGVKLVHCRKFGSVTRWHDEGRLHVGGMRDRRKLRDRAVAHCAILDHALAAGFRAGDPDLAWFGRDLFMLARICARQGLGDSASALLAASLRAGGADGTPPRDARLFGSVAQVIGWKGAGMLASGLEWVRRRGQSNGRELH